ncbi:hypothetical protein BB559_003601 [Furculomyces boomerangus]|uniref:Uncharacterized protein n=2 Tax=Harpellales TaxID=61421 RepID=A0A2T9YKB8_9FUNG|nr:hypothetical protein BB559_003601 [Furculomyces boomerangus]PVZ96771.1 hypothetical protein BB558_007307 [Smittium angustum]PWA03033.1 hypothetical protein BB558_000824 [Smittium angustum]
MEQVADKTTHPEYARIAGNTKSNQYGVKDIGTLNPYNSKDLFSVRAMADCPKDFEGDYTSTSQLALYQPLPFKKGDRINVVGKLPGGIFIGYSSEKYSKEDFNAETKE